MALRGRPAREPTAAQREKVRELKAEGASQRVIAAALELSAPTLRKLFPAELELEKKSGAKENIPPIRITEQMRADVALMAACNEPHRRIARAIGVSEPDLAKWFAEDLETGAARYRLKTLQRLDALAPTTLGAAKALEALTAPQGDETATARPGYVGKKAQAKAEADATVAAGGKFAPRAAPKLAAVDGKRL